MTHPSVSENDAVQIPWHRRYVGGLWERIGRLQFDFLVGQGLRPDHVLLDVACGSLRAGVHFIPYLDAGNYLGIDHNEKLIDAGIQLELGSQLFHQKRPAFVVSEEFEFERFEKVPNIALAQSLFTHLPPRLIVKCLRKLRAVIAGDGCFFATFNESPTPVANPTEPHDHRVFRYMQAQMARFGRTAGWRMEYVGAWRHPRGQRMLIYWPD